MSGDQTRDPGEGEGVFNVQDRRRFNPDTGDLREDKTIHLPGGGVLKDEPEPEPEPVDLPVTFAELLQPFLLVGLAGLGILPHPETQKPEINLPAAAVAIESLELLAKKTEGNRTPEESRLLDQALYELKMQFVEIKERLQRG